MKTMQLIKDGRKTQKTRPQRSASDTERFLNTFNSDKKLQWSSSKIGNFNEIDEARNHSKL